MSPSKPSTSKRRRGDGAVFQRCDADRGCPPRVPVLDDDGNPVLTRSGKPRMARPEHTCHGMWVARLDLGDDSDGKPLRPQRASATQNGALAVLDDMKELYIRQGNVPTKNPTVESWVTQWLAEIVRPHKDPGTYTTYRSATKHIIRHLGRQRLDRLTPKHLRDMYAKMAKRGDTGMRPSAHRTLRNALNAAMRESLLMRNVAELVPEPAGLGTKRIALSGDQGRQFLMHVSRVDEHGRPADRYFARWAMALLTGLRQGECIGLEIDRVDMQQRVMDVSWKLERITFDHGCADEPSGDVWPCGRRYGGHCPDQQLRVPDNFEYRQLHGGLCLTRPKSDASIRIIPIPPPLHAAFTFHLETDTGPNPHGLMWREPSGQPILSGDDNERWDANLRATGLPAVTLHEARNTAITMLMEAGTDPTVIQAIAGHSSLVVQERYKHVDTRHMAEALGKVAGRLYLEESGDGG